LLAYADAIPDSRVRVHFSQAQLDRTAINTVYSHVLNPMVASRSYMCIEPIELHLDVNALRRGLIMPVDPDTEPTALLVQDSGMVPVSTQISIVNPETNQLCLVGEYGEIWVQSEANAHSFYGSKDRLDTERFNGRTVDGDPNVRYVRTGDLGFLHNVTRPIGPNGAPVDMQVLFVLGSIGDTFEVNGLNHFSMDIEQSVERCHRNIVPGGCAVFQAGGLVVVVVEIFRRNFLASMVPVIVNAILNEHQLVIDIVAFVIKGDFHRSRLGEKQRGKILAGWVTRKMRTIAQYSIRDPNGPENQMMISEEPRASMSMSIGGMRAGSTKGSMRAGSMLGLTAQLNSMQLANQQHNAINQEIPGQGAPENFAQPQPPQNYYPPSIPEVHDDKTPTEARHSFLPQSHSMNQPYAPMEYSPIDRAGPYGLHDPNGPGEGNYQQQTYGNAQAPLPEILQPGLNPTPFYSDSQPYEYTHQDDRTNTGRWSFDDDPVPQQSGGLRVANYGNDDDSDAGGSGYTAQQGGGGGLRVANFDSNDGEGGGLRVANRGSMSSEMSEKSWARDALAGLNFAGGNAQ
jgi:hypothetical protein